MLDGIQHRAIKAGVQERIRLHLTKADSIGINDSIDFCLAFWMIHEVPDRNHLLNEISSKLTQDGLMLIAEPRMHVSQADFNKTLEIAKNAGLSIVDRPGIFLSHSVLLKK
jgi:SAM-dependent methyltransferase